MAPHFQLAALRSVHLQVPDLIVGLDFYTHIWGLLDVAQAEGVHYLRGIGDDPYLLALSEGDTAVVEITYRAHDQTDLATLRAQMIAAGASEDGAIGPRMDYGGGTGFAVRDHARRRIGIVQSDQRPAPLDNDAYRPIRLAHTNINSATIDRDIAFHKNGMGMDLTDRSSAMAFLRCNGDHHAVVLASAEVDTLNHISFLHDHYDDMMRAGGKMCDAGFPIGWGPGRHGPGDNVFFYFVDPFGIVIEHTAEVLQVDDTYPVGGPNDWIWPAGRVDKWGICPPKSDACKAAQLAIPFK